MSADKDLISVQQARDLVEGAHRAQAEVARFDQAKIDRICDAMAKAALRESPRVAALAVEETGYGVAEDKQVKNQFSAEIVWNYFKNLRTVGVVSETKDVVEIASPRGVVAGIVPSTNPTSTAIFKILIAIKSRNAIVLSPHPSAARCINETVKVMREAGVNEGLPAEAIGCMTTATIEGTEALMKHKMTAVILATGGIGLVRAAYSSGKPAFGVGPGNVPVFIERSADVPKAVQDILTGKCFDNGTICASEQAIIVDAPIEMAVRDEDHVAFVDGLEILRCSRVVHDPRVDEDLLALGAAGLPCAVTDPRERHRIVECHQEDSPTGRERWRRSARRLAAHMATTPTIPISARTRRTKRLEYPLMSKAWKRLWPGPIKRKPAATRTSTVQSRRRMLQATRTNIGSRSSTRCVPHE